MPPFTRHVMASCLSEAAAKGSCLVVVTAARSLDAEAIGLAVATIATVTVVKALAENGVGRRIIAAHEDELEVTCLTARRIFRLRGLGLFVAQVLAGAAIWAATGNATLFWLILSPLAAALLWQVSMRRLHSWTPLLGVPTAPIRPFIRHGAAVPGAEVARALRMQADKLVNAAIPGVIRSAAVHRLRAHNRPQVEFHVTLALTLALIANTVIDAPYGLTALAFGSLVLATVIQIGAAIPALAPAYRPHIPKAA